MNDVTDYITLSTFVKLFADNLKLSYSEFSCPVHSNNIQHNLDMIFFFTWSYTWQLPISTPKCNTFHLGSSPANSYTISNHYLCNVSPVKDFGILVDSGLKFVDHIQDIVSRASKRANLVFRCFLSRNTTNLSKAFVTYVRPLLEYASPVWSPSYLYLINHIESVQKSFTKRLSFRESLSYAERLSNLRLQSLEHRRMIFDLILVFKIIHGFSCLNFDDFFSFANNNRSSRGHPFRLYIPITLVISFSLPGSFWFGTLLLFFFRMLAQSYTPNIYTPASYSITL